MIRFNHLSISLLLLLATSGMATSAYAASKSKKASNKCCTATQPVRNVILMIGDGMGVTQVSAAMLANGAPLAMQQSNFAGMLCTRSASNDVTDSAAAATALATGTKTTNGMIGVAPDSTHLRSILVRAEEKGMATGLIATHMITDATPAAFIAHNPNRSNEEDIAADFLKTDIDLFIGGGRKKFEKRADGRNLSDELRTKGYKVGYSLDSLAAWNNTPVGLLLAESAMPNMNEGRGDMLPRSTREALRLLDKNSKNQGFFLMVEGSSIDDAGHRNDSTLLMAEMRDFDAAVRIAKEYADKTPGTVVIITADHETGGLTLPSVKLEKIMGKVQPGTRGTYRTHYSTTSHSAAMVPLYIYGAGADQFGGLIENTDLPKRIATVLGLPE